MSYSVSQKIRWVSPIRSPLSICDRGCSGRLPLGCAAYIGWETRGLHRLGNTQSCEESLPYATSYVGKETHKIVKNPSPYEPTYIGWETHKVVKNPSLYKAYLWDYSDGDTTERDMLISPPCVLSARETPKVSTVVRRTIPTNVNKNANVTYKTY